MMEVISGVFTYLNIFYIFLFRSLFIRWAPHGKLIMYACKKLEETAA
jgi:hypothetical protein